DVQSDHNNYLREDILIDEPTSATNKKIIAQYIDILKMSLENTEDFLIDQAVEYLHNAKTIVCFGVGNSNLFAEYFVNQLIATGLNAYTNNNSHVVLSTLLRMNQNDVVVLFSESGESSEVIKIASKTKELGIKVIALTKEDKCQLHQYSDLVLKTISYQTKNLLNTRTIRISQLSIIDMLALNLMKKDIRKYESNAIKSRALVASLNHNKEKP
ncbi:MAG: MurR/RpiR family transcriptional regulator, partial [Bacilli bacterium]